MSRLLSAGFVPPSGTLQVGGQFVDTVNPPQPSTGGEQSAVVPSQHLQQGRSHLAKTNSGSMPMPAW